MWCLVCVALLVTPVFANPIDKEAEEVDRSSKQFVSPLLLPTLVDLEPKVRNYVSDQIDGIVKVTFRGVPGTVCESGVDDNAAHVICKMVARLEGLDEDFMTGRVVTNAVQEFGPGNLPITLSHITCPTSREHSLDSCYISPTNTHQCTPAGVTCRLGDMLTFHGERLAPGASVVQPESPTIRLVGGDPDHLGRVLQGRIEIFAEGQWWAVCDDNFDNMDARVACRALGLMDGQAVPFAHWRYGRGQLGMWLDELQCTGTEPTLEACPHAGRGIHDCDVEMEGAAVSCSPGRTPIAPQAPSLFGSAPVQPVPRPLPPPVQPLPRPLPPPVQPVRAPVFPAPVYPVPPPLYPVPPKPISSGIAKRDLLSPITEPLAPVPPVVPVPPVLPPVLPAHQLAAISPIYVRDQYIYDIYPVSFQLSGAPDAGAVQIVDYSRGAMTLCADGWTAAKAQVVCSTLGYLLGDYFPQDQFSLLPPGATAMTLIDCDIFGRDQCIGGGPFVASTYCGSFTAATVRCSTPAPPPPPPPPPSPYVQPPPHTRTVELIGPTSYEGILYIHNDGMFGTICNSTFDDVDAFVACRELGFTAGVAVENAARVYGEGMGAIWIKDVACSGTEAHLSDCPHSGYGMTNDCKHSMDAGVRCSFS